MTTIDQLGKGHNDRGLYTGKNQSEPEVRLEPKEEGTFLFPPTRYRDAQDYAQFWTTVPISDGVLANITAGYADMVRRQLTSDGITWGHRYDAAHEKDLHSGSEASIAAARRAREKAYEEWVEEWHLTKPRRIRAGSARTIARAGQLYYYTAGLSEEDKELIHSSTLFVEGNDWTVEQVEATFQLRNIREHFQDPEVTAAERLEDLRQELRLLQR